ncbi:MAG TPA: hypothetical protein VGI39_14590 [Polyangiaceae bacterium]|jgi:hypothetical protein
MRAQSTEAFARASVPPAPKRLGTAASVIGGALLGSVAASAAAFPLFAGVGNPLRVETEEDPVPYAESWSAASGAWSLAGTQPGARDAPELVPLQDGHVFVTGGFWGTESIDTSWLWDPAGGSFASLAAPAMGHECRSAARLAGEGFEKVVVTSSSDDMSFGEGAVHGSVFDVAQASWKPIAVARDHAVRTVVPLPSGRALFVFAEAAAVWDGKTETWVTPPPAEAPPLNGDGCPNTAWGALLEGGRALVVARVVRPDDAEWAWTWDPATGLLTRADDLQNAISALHVVAKDETFDVRGLYARPGGGAALVVDGRVGLVPASLASIELISGLPSASGVAVAPVAGGKLLLAGGWHTAMASRDAWLVDLGTKSVQKAPALHHARWAGGAAALPDGRVVVAGGSTQTAHFPWSGVTSLVVSLGALAGVAWIARRSARPWVVVASAVAGGFVLAAVGGTLFLYAAGSAIRG